MDSENFNNFDQRLNQWIANQGFWFHLRYSLTGSSRGSVVFHLLRLLYRVIVAIAITLLGSWLFIMYTADSSKMVKKQEEAIKSALFASKISSRGYHHAKAHLEINRVAAEGSDQSFFNSLELKNLRCNKGYLDSYLGSWNPGLIAAAQANIHLRAGADSPEQGSAFAAALFTPNIVDHLEFADTNLYWGYSSKNRGSIANSELKASRTDDGWRVKLIGGTFSQNWLRDLDIVEIDAMITPKKITFTKAIFEKNKASVDLSGLTITCAPQPVFSGTAKLYNLPIPQIISGYDDFISGSISGEFKVLGSTNSNDGIRFKGSVILDGSDTISLSSHLPILKVLSVLDHKNSYHHLTFNEGSFDLESGSESLRLSNIQLNTKDHISLQGAFLVRPPNEEETKSAFAFAQNNSPSSTSLITQDPANEANQKNATLSLKQAALAIKKQEDTIRNSTTTSLFERIALQSELRSLEVQETERRSHIRQYEGRVVLSIPSSSFSRFPNLAKEYPSDLTSGFTAIPIPIQGDLYHITQKQAEDIYARGQH